MSDERSERTSYLLEFIAVLLLGITTVGTAWCGFQSSRWNGVQTDLSRQASDERVEANRLFGLATQKVVFDANMVAMYAQAFSDGNTRLAEFYRTTLVRPDFVPVLDAWVAQVAAGQVPTPLLEDPDYMETQFGEYYAATAKAEATSVLSDLAGDNADAYVISTILLAVSLFFAGVTSSFRYRPARVLLLVLGLGTLAFAATRLADLPVSF